MSNEIKLAADSRTEFGKGAARRLRRENKVPAVIYGHGTDPVHIALPGHDTLLALRTANALLSISVDGGRTQLALPKQVQRDPIKGFLEHVDLLIVRRGEKVTVDVPLVLLGEVEDGVINVDLQTLSLAVEATHIPAQIEVDVTPFPVGKQLTVGELRLPEGATYTGDPSDLILTVAAPISEEALEASLESPEGAGAVAAEESVESSDEAGEE